MSLINQMLKDLEQRRSPNNAEKKFLSDLHSPRKDDHDLIRQEFKKIGAVITLAVLAIILFILMIHRSKPPPSPHHAPPLADRSSMPHPDRQSFPTSGPQAIVDIPPEQPSSDLTELKIDGDLSVTQFKLSFVSSALYALDQESPQIYSFLFHNVTYNTFCKAETDVVKCFAPVISDQIQHNLVEHVDVTFPEPNQIKFRITVNKDASIKSLDTTDPGNVVLTLTNANAPPTPAPSTTPIIKSSEGGTSVDEDYQKALHLIAEQHISEGLTQLQILVAKYPIYTPARSTLATLYIKLGRVNEAENLLRVGRTLSPGYAPFVELQARLYMSRRCYNEALALLTSLSPPLAQNLGFYALLAALYQQLNQPQNAVLIYQRLLEYQPYNAVWWLGLGVALEGSNKNNMAAEAYRKAKSSARLSPIVEDYVDTRLRALGG